MKDDGQQDRPRDRSGESFEGDYRPAREGVTPRVQARTDPLQLAFLMRLANALNTTLDLQTLMQQTADLVRAVIDYRIFAILLLNDRTNDLRMRFQIGHTPETERRRFRMGKGIVGQAASRKEPVLVNDVRTAKNYITANHDVRSELAVPLIVKNRVIGVIDIQSEQVGYFQQEHLRLLELTASRVALAIENARLYTRVSRQAQTLAVLNEISRDITSILDLDALLERIGQLLRRLIDYQMFTILLLNERDQVLETQFAVRFGERYVPLERVPLGRGLVGVAVKTHAPVYSPDVRKDQRYHMVNPETRSEMAVPLIYKEKVIGVLDLEHTRSTTSTKIISASSSRWRRRSPSPSRTRGSTSASRSRSSGWSTIWTWRAKCSFGCCRNRSRSFMPPNSPPAFCRRAPSAATSTTFFRTTINAPASRWAMSAARPRRRRSTPRWSAASCARLRRVRCIRKRCCACSTTRCRSAAGRAVRHHGLRGLERREPDAADRQRRRGAAAVLPQRRSGDGPCGGLSARHVPGCHLRGVHPIAAPRRFGRLFQRRHRGRAESEGEMFGTEQLCELVQQNASLGANELADLLWMPSATFRAASSASTTKR